METKYTVKQLYDMVEVLDVYDAMKKEAYDLAKAESNNSK